MSTELTLSEFEPGWTIVKQFNTVTIHFHSEEEAEVFYIALTEAERTGTFMKIDFNRRQTTKNL